MKRKLLSILLILALVLTMMPAFGLTAFGETLPTLNNVKIENGVISWDEMEEAGYCIRFDERDDEYYAEESPFDLNYYFERDLVSTGTYHVTLFATSIWDGSQKSQSWTGTFDFTARPKLGEATGFAWNGTTVTWNPVKNATEYCVAVFVDFGDLSTAIEYTNDPTFDISPFLEEGTHNYHVWVSAGAEGYRDGDSVPSAWSEEMTYTLPELCSLKVSPGGEMSWDWVLGADHYDFGGKVGYGYLGDSTTETEVDLYSRLVAMGASEGQYTFAVSAYKGDKKLTTETFVTYNFQRKPQLEKPTNVTFSDGQLSWDAVDNSNYYTVEICADGEYEPYETIYYVYNNSIDVSPFYLEGEHDYFFYVTARGWAYEDSEKVIYRVPASINTVKPELGNVVLNNGVLTWDAMNGATRYVLEIDGEENGLYENYFSIKAKFESLGLDAGEHTLKLYAQKNGGVISKVWEGTYSYTPAYGKLASTTVGQWNGSVINWSPVENANEYLVYIYRDSADSEENFCNLEWVTGSSLDISYLIDEGNHKYVVKVIAQAKGYANSDGALSDLSPTLHKDCYTHSYGGWLKISSPSCDLSGVEKRKCINCGHEETRGTSGGHKLVDVAGQKPTCQAEGWKAHQQCSKCSKLFINGIETTFDEIALPAIVLNVPAKATAVLTTKYSKTSGYNDVKFTWSATNDASGYNVYYKKSTATKWTKIGSYAKPTAVYKKDLANGSKYLFKVVPYKTVYGVKSECPSAAKTTTVYTLKKLAVPTVTKSGTKVKVKWNNIEGETGYQISQSTTKKGTKIVATYATTKGTSKVIKATKGKTYYYKVRAYKTVNGVKIYGPWSAVKAYKR